MRHFVLQEFVPIVPKDITEFLSMSAKEFINQSHSVGCINIDDIVRGYSKEDLLERMTFRGFHKFCKESYDIDLKGILEYEDNIILDIYEDNNKLKFIDHYDFELAIAKLMKCCHGFETLLTKKTRDGGYDIIATKNIPFPIKFLVECKTSSSTIGVDVLRSFKFVIDDLSASCGLIVTNSQFSKELKKLADKFKHRVSLIDFSGIISMVNYYVNKYLFRLAF